MVGATYKALCEQHHSHKAPEVALASTTARLVEEPLRSPERICPRQWGRVCCASGPGRRRTTASRQCADWPLLAVESRCRGNCCGSFAVTYPALDAATFRPAATERRQSW